jgi:protein-S-isoprenylcysteine O-methyltransferase Ste14
MLHALTPTVAAVHALWFFWVVSWVLAAAWSRPAVKRPSEPAEGLARLVIIVGFGLIFLEGPILTFATPLWVLAPAAAWGLVVVTLAAFTFCWWARLHLGPLWSAATTIKPGHQVIDTGPYRLVRHPIYTGILMAAAARAALYPTVTSVLGVAVLTLGFWMKARVEERFLTAELGADAYGAYARRVRMLIPFVV